MASKRTIAAAIVAGVAVIAALLAIPVTRRLIGALLIAAITLGGCEITMDSTEKHCDTFEEGYHNMEPEVFAALSALVDPPEGETVDPEVQNAALAVLAVASLMDVNDPTADELDAFGAQVDALLAACAKAAE